MSRARILAVDDERFFQEAISDVLGEADLEVVVAGSGAEALELIDDMTLGVVVLDLQLPDRHGLDVFREFKQRRPDLRVVILSAHTDQDNVLEALRLGAFDYLAKPLHEEELRLSVLRALETHELDAGWSRLRERLLRLDGRIGALDAAAADAEGSSDVLGQLAVEAAAEILGAAKTSLMLVDDDAGELRVTATYGNKLQAEQLDPVPLGEGIAGDVALRREPLVVGEIGEDERFKGRASGARYDSGSFAITPLLSGARTLGVLCAADPAPGRRFGADDLALLRILGVQLAQSLAQPVVADAAAGADGSRAELEFLPDDDDAIELRSTGGDARATELARAVCEGITTELEPARVLAAALRPVAELLGAAPVSIHLVEPGSGELVREAEQDGGRRTDRERLAPGGLAAAVLAGRAVIASDDPSGDPRFDPAIDTPEDGVAGPLICVPLTFRGVALGIARVFPEQAADASPELGEVLAATLSAAVRNAILYRSLVDTIDEVAEVRRNQAAPPPGR